MMDHAVEWVITVIVQKIHLGLIFLRPLRKNHTFLLELIWLGNTFPSHFDASQPQINSVSAASICTVFVHLPHRQQTFLTTFHNNNPHIKYLAVNNCTINPTPSHELNFFRQKHNIAGWSSLKDTMKIQWQPQIILVGVLIWDSKCGEKKHSTPMIVQDVLDKRHSWESMYWIDTSHCHTIHEFQF